MKNSTKHNVAAQKSSASEVSYKGTVAGLPLIKATVSAHRLSDLAEIAVGYNPEFSGEIMLSFGEAIFLKVTWQFIDPLHPEIYGEWGAHPKDRVLTSAAYRVRAYLVEVIDNQEYEPLDPDLRFPGEHFVEASAPSMQLHYADQLLVHIGTPVEVPVGQLFEQKVTGLRVLGTDRGPEIVQVACKDDLVLTVAIGRFSAGLRVEDHGGLELLKQQEWTVTSDSNHVEDLLWEWQGESEHPEAPSS